MFPDTVSFESLLMAPLQYSLSSYSEGTMIKGGKAVLEQGAFADLRMALMERVRRG